MTFLVSEIFEFSNCLIIFYKKYKSYVPFQQPRTFNPKGSPRICAVDCGLKYNQVNPIKTDLLNVQCYFKVSGKILFIYSLTSRAVE
jgi:hypothetical protein